MKINENAEIKKTQDGKIYFYDPTKKSIMVEPTDSNYSEWLDIYNRFRVAATYDRPDIYANITLPFEETSVDEVEAVEVTPEEKVMRGLTNIIKFFSEFEFEPNYRFINTLGFKVVQSKTAARNYIVNYFSLTDNQYKNEVKDKIKSKEFDHILEDLSASSKPEKVINKRFKVYYGSAGTGKTTLAQSEAENRCIVCNASMLPADLMEDFCFEDGKPSFKPSVLWNCMTEGKPIVLDEINLLPFDSLRFLQGILDGKAEFDYKGRKVVIADGFQIIGTMNLAIGGMVYGLPEPLVDRCADMKEFRLTANMLKSALA
jgi:hypothetical protein